jgi:hypothetical protein
MNTSIALNFMRSAKAPHTMAAVMMAKVSCGDAACRVSRARGGTKAPADVDKTRESEKTKER